jgi:hypothetical protein
MISGNCAGRHVRRDPTELGRRRGVDGDRLWKAASGDRSSEMDRTLEVVVLPVSDMARSVAIDRC